MVGTRADKFRVEKNEELSSLLYQHFDLIVSGHLIENREGMGRRRMVLKFFPVGNVDPRLTGAGAVTDACEGISTLREVIKRHVVQSGEGKEEIPYIWTQALVKMRAQKKSYLGLKTVEELCKTCQMPDPDIPMFLHKMDKLSVLLWKDEIAVSDVVILDSVKYLVKPASAVICKHTPTGDDATYHSLPIHRECKAKYAPDWTNFIRTGFISGNILWTIVFSFSKDEAEASQVIRYMVRLELLVPDRRPSTAPSSDWSTVFNLYNTMSFLVPPLLPPCPEDSVLRGNGWCSGPFHSCVIGFTTSTATANQKVVLGYDLSLNFYPLGVFERLLSSAIAWFHQSVLADTFPRLHKDLVILDFDSEQSVRIMLLPKLCSIRLDVKGRNPVAKHVRVLDMVESAVQQTTMTVCVFSVLPLGEVNVSSKYVNLTAVREAVDRDKTVDAGDGIRFTADELQTQFQAWLLHRGGLDRYDVFLSYRWGEKDSQLVDAVFEQSRGHEVKVGDERRAVDIFLDKERLQKGEDFCDSFFGALVASLVVAPLLSTDAIQRMCVPYKDEVDNVLLEWITALECKERGLGRVEKLCPLVLGPWDASTGKRGKLVTDALSDVVPSKTLLKARELFTEHGLELSAEIQRMTVRQIVGKMNVYNGHVIGDINFKDVRKIAGECCEQIVHVLKECPPHKLYPPIPITVDGRECVLVKGESRGEEAEERKLTPLETAWNILSDPECAKDSERDKLVKLLKDLGLRSAEDLGIFLEDDDIEEDLKTMQSCLTKMDCKKFRKALPLSK